ncbi:hypothetical protein ACQ4M3_30725 [Leptolyngbya sp. AN03gr2]|uniref:hypothetical protein n=1 Tax=unclassified Leptolyngbya TaxID=2650499 RepID=UPI003D31B4D7
MVQTFKTQDIQALLQEWELSEAAISVLAKESEIVAELIRARHLPLLPPGYVPTVVELLFDDIPYVRSEKGQVVYLRHCEPDYQPPFVEYRFDGQMAVFQVGGECVVNRVEGMAQAIALQGLLYEED